MVRTQSFLTRKGGLLTMRLSNFLPFRAKSPSLGNRSTQNSCNAWTEVIRKWASHRGESFSPPVDVIETDKDLCIVADLPGLKAGHLEISLSEGTLLLKGERQKERRPDRTFFLRNGHVVGSNVRFFCPTANWMQMRWT